MYKNVAYTWFIRAGDGLGNHRGIGTRPLHVVKWRSGWAVADAWIVGVNWPIADESVVFLRVKATARHQLARYHWRSSAPKTIAVNHNSTMRSSYDQSPSAMRPGAQSYFVRASRVKAWTASSDARRASPSAGRGVTACSAC